MDNVKGQNMSIAFVKEFYPEIGVPVETIPYLTYYSSVLDGDERFHDIVDRFMAEDGTSTADILKEVAETAAAKDVHAYTAHLIFYAFCAEIMLAKYHERGIAEDIFWDSNRDLTWKCRECLECFGIPGTSVGDWHADFYRLRRFALGRLQYEHRPYPYPEYTKAGITIKKGNDVLNVHIPSCGPLTPEKRQDSYRRAWEFYHKDFKDGIVPIGCSSWLLFKGHEDFLPPTSNILGFLHDFDLQASSEKDRFSEAWRVFGRYAKYPPEAWPRDTSIRRAFADRILSGGKTGSGYGIFLFNGEKKL